MGSKDMEDVSRDEAIKFFRKFVAKKEGLSDEEAGRAINKSVEIGLDLLDPLCDLQKKISDLMKKSQRDGIVALMSTIEQLMSDMSVKSKTRILLAITMKVQSESVEKGKESGEKMDDELFKFLKDRDKNRGG